MSNTFKMPEPVATIASWTNGSYWRNYKISWHGQAEMGDNLYTSKQVKEILEQCAKELEHMGGFKDGYSCGSMLREIKEMVK